MLSEIHRRLVDEPIVERLGLEEAHFSISYDRAIEKLESGDPEAALQDLAKLVLVSPTSVQFQFGLAQAAIRAGLPELAMQAAAVIITAMPDRPEGFLLSGQACLAMGETGLAKEDLACAIAKADADPRGAAIGKLARQAMILLEGQ